MVNFQQYFCEYFVIKIDFGSDGKELGLSCHFQKNENKMYFENEERTLDLSNGTSHEIFGLVS